MLSLLPHRPFSFSALKTSLAAWKHSNYCSYYSHNPDLPPPSHSPLSIFLAPPFALAAGVELQSHEHSQICEWALYLVREELQIQQGWFSWFSCCLFLDQSPRNKRWQIPIRSRLIYHSGANLRSFSCLCENFFLLYVAGESCLMPGKLWNCLLFIVLSGH